jgi:hypothetical protein
VQVTIKNEMGTEREVTVTAESLEYLRRAGVPSVLRQIAVAVQAATKGGDEKLGHGSACRAYAEAIKTKLNIQ